MAEFRVDHEALGRLAARLRDVVNSLEDIEALARSQDGDLGDTRLQGSLHNFAADWEDNVSDLAEEARDLAKILRNTANTYRTHDRSLAKEFEEASS